VHVALGMVRQHVFASGRQVIGYVTPARLSSVNGSAGQIVKAAAIAAI
jgi:hypothetical protein